jgi:hypothetical protein
MTGMQNRLCLDMGTSRRGKAEQEAKGEMNIIKVPYNIPEMCTIKAVEFH